MIQQRSCRPVGTGYLVHGLRQLAPLLLLFLAAFFFWMFFLRSFAFYLKQPMTARETITLLIQAVCSLLAVPAFADDAPPRAEVREVTDTYFGTPVADPYRWMEDKGPALDAWMKAQAAYAKARLDALPERDALLKRIDALSEAVAEVSVARR